MGIAGEFKKERGIEQVEAEGFGKNLLQPGALARPPGAEHEKRSIGTLEQTWDGGLGFHFHSAYNVVNLHCKVTTYWPAGQAHFHFVQLFLPRHSTRGKNAASTPLTQAHPPGSPAGQRVGENQLN